MARKSGPAKSGRAATNEIIPKDKPRQGLPDAGALQTTSSEASCLIVGIGASAGSQDALEQLFTAMPADCGLSFVVIMHLPSEGASFLAEILSRYTAMEVVTAEDGMSLAPNRVQIIPAGWELTVTDGRLQLETPDEMRGAHHPVDRFFRSLAAEIPQRAVAVVLSGFGRDGAQGVQAIRDAGGVVMVQEPGSAINPDMPRNAIATGAADYILAADQMPAKIAEIAHGSCSLLPRTCRTATLEEELHAIFEIVRTRTGHDFSSYKSSTVLRRIERRMAVNDTGGIGKYLTLLQENPQEAQALSQDILIGVTSFFRDPDAFAVLEREVIPRLFANRGSDQPVRIWHACCATGEEVYSMAILVREYLDARGLNTKVQFFATDIDEVAIAQARAGLYSDDVAAEVGKERLKTFFTRINNRWQVAKQLREMIVFAHHSLIKDPPFSRLDLAVCRNFLIYVTPDMQKRIIALLHQVLKPGGFLFLGAAESVGHNLGMFAAIDKKWKIFERRESGRRSETLFPLADSFRRPSGIGRPLRRAETPEPSPEAAAQRFLAERYAPPCVVVNEKYEVVHVSIGADRFLRVPAGEPTRDILKMAREELRPALRAAIYKAFAEQVQMVFREVQVDLDGANSAVNVLVEPLDSPHAAGKLALVVFEPAPPQEAYREPAAGEATPAGDEASSEVLVHQLEQQLRLTHEQLQASNEQLETTHEGFLSANEELLSINEEFQSANEELQSTNEELETSKVELQALNEELVTVNTELQGTVEELNQAKSDTENLLTSSEIATLFLDRRLHIKRYTPALAAIFNLIPADIGRPFRHLAGTIDWSELPRDAEEVLETLLPREREVTAVQDGRHYLMRVLPYRAAEGKIDGIVVTLVDLTERKRMENALLKAKKEWERTFDSVPDLIAIMDDQHHIVRANRALAERLGTTPQACVGQLCYRALHGTDKPPEYCPHAMTMRDGLEHEAEVHEERLAGDFLISTTPLLDERGRMVGSVHVARDITERKRAEEALYNSKQQVEQHLAQLQAILDHLSDGVVISDLQGNVFHWNPAAIAMHGFASMEQCQRRLPEFAGTFELATEEEGVLPLEQWPLARILAGETLRDWEVQLRRLETDWQRVFSYGGTLTRGKDGQPLLAVVSVTDITERKRTEEVQARLAAIVNTSDDAIISKDLEGIIRTWNAGAEKMFGYRSDEAVGKPIVMLIPPGQRAEEEQIQRRLAAGESIGHFETVRLARDGREIEVSVSVSPIKERGGRIIGVSKIVRDITARKRGEEALQKIHLELEQRVQERTEELATTVETLLTEISEREQAQESLRRLNRLYAVLSEIDLAIVRATDRDSLFRDFCRIAVEQGDFLLAWVGLVEPESGQVRMVAASGVTAYLDDIRITANEETAGEGPTGISLREGTYYICNDFQNDPHTRPWQEKGRVHGIRATASIALKEQGHVFGALSLYAGEKDFFDQQHVALLRQMGADISFALENLSREARRREAELALQEETLERMRAMEELRESERILIQQSRQAAMGDMIGNIAHQWRQPLNTLGLMVQELPMCYESGDFSGEYLEHTVNKVMQIIRHMSQTIDDFRNFFQPDKDKVDFRGRQVIDKVRSIVDASLKEHRIELAVSAKDDPLIHGYPNEYSQVLLNILLNARDAFIERAVERPRIEVTLSEENGRSVVTIDDNAGGIPVEILDKIFDPYFTTKGPDKGSGVGLYMSKAIIEKNMNGRLTACNSENGAQFRIEV